jgi:hypothetical protein
MTRFVDGPAAGITLYLRRAPLFLRAVRERGHDTWDALDQIEDVPKTTEEIVVYKLEGEPSWMHINRRGGGGIYRGGTYRVVDPQPADERLRDVFHWREWALAAAAQHGAAS